MNTIRTDPATFTILSQGFGAIAREMSSTLIRTAYSPVIREAADASTSLLDPAGRVISQAENIPLHLNSMEPAFRACDEKLDRDRLSPESVWITNDPYRGGGQHLSDIFLFSPIFYADELVGFAGSVGHYVDIGHSRGFNLHAADIYEERMLFPPSQFSLGSDWNGGLFERLIAANVRMPEATIGDLNAQLAANHVGAARFCELVERNGAEVVQMAIEDFLDYGEGQMRAEIGAIPDGVYEAEEFLDGDGLTEEPVRIAVQARVEGSECTVSFAGTAAQVQTALNCPPASTVSAVRSAMKCVVTNADLPLNQGFYRPVVVEDAPLGSILNPQPNLPVEARALAAVRVFTAVVKAFSACVPERVNAPGFDTRTAVDFHYVRPGQPYVAMSDLHGGGYGAGADLDGADQIDDPLGNCKNTPVEALEAAQDFFLVRAYELRQDSGGAGRRRGGLGALRSYEMLRDGVFMTLYSDHFERPAPGLFGGLPGAPAAARVVRGEEEIELRPTGSTELKAGDLVEVRIGGGGGYGPPGERDPELLAADIEDGRVSKEMAESVYGQSD